MAARYDALPDDKRWHLLNLLRYERSPLLWFSVQRDDAPARIPTQRQICDSFLATTFLEVLHAGSPLRSRQERALSRG